MESVGKPYPIPDIESLPARSETIQQVIKSSKYMSYTLIILKLQ